MFLGLIKLTGNSSLLPIGLFVACLVLLWFFSSEDDAINDNL